MSERTAQHIGDDQLVYGMPKRMVGISTSAGPTGIKKADADRREEHVDPESNSYWTVHPATNACEKCKALAGKRFVEEPERPHPNCKCEIRKHPLRKPTRYISGSVEGFAIETFVGGRQVDISFEGVSGGLTSGVHLTSNQGHSEQIACMPSTSNSTTLTTDQTPPVDWRINLIAAGSDNVLIYYTITYDDWSE